MNIAIIDRDLARIKRCQTAILSFADCQICWIAQSLEETLRKVKFNRPDLILVSIECAFVVDAIMQEAPTAILLLTGSKGDQNEMIFRAMRRGVLDIAKVDETGDLSELKAKIGMMQLLLRSGTKLRKREKGLLRKVQDTRYPPLVAIGASTGGPAALAKLLASFSDDFHFATVIVQHVDALFALGLADWLQKESALPVEVVKAGSRPEVGKIVLASTNDHLVVSRGGQLHYTSYPPDINYRPSIDVFFKSLAQNWPEPGVAVLLTGMGSDGADGLKKLSDLGWCTIAEHEESCAVYGMPKAAIAKGATRIVLPIEEIGKKIMEAFS